MCSYKRKVFECFFYNINEMMGEFRKEASIVKYGMSSNAVIRFLRNPLNKFNIVISELKNQEMTYFISETYDCPLVLISPVDIDYPTFEALGTFSIWSHIPLISHFQDFSNTILKRLSNRIISGIYKRIRKSNHINPIDRIVPNVKGETQGVLKIEERSSLIMFNSLQGLTHSLWDIPGVVDLSGIHINEIGPLPASLKVKKSN